MKLLSFFYNLLFKTVNKMIRGKMISFDTQIPASNQFFELFISTGWNENYKLTEQEIYTAIKNSWYFVSAYEDGKLIGCARMISDGICHSLILDMIVYPEYQLKGIGRELMNMLIEKCKENKIRDIQLFCAKGKKEFYEKLGFASRPDEGPGMEIKMKYL